MVAMACWNRYFATVSHDHLMRRPPYLLIRILTRTRLNEAKHESMNTYCIDSRCRIRENRDEDFEKMLVDDSTEN
jgi:hypothetical protein